MKKIILITSIATTLAFYSCGNSSDRDINDDLMLVQEEIAADREALAEEIAEENISINPEILIDKWWIPDEMQGGTDQFFRKDGAYDTDLGKLGTWEWIVEGQSIKIVDNNQEAFYDIIELNETVFRFKYKNSVYTYYPKAAAEEINQ